MFEDVQTFEEEFGGRIKLPSSIVKVWSILGLAYDYRFNEDFKQNNVKVRKLYNKYKGERCFIVGTGPSLKRTNFDLIKNEVLIGVNTLYRGTERFRIKPKYWVVVDGKLFEKYYKDLLYVPDTTLFLGEYAGKRFLANKKKYALDSIKPIILRHLGSVNIWQRFSKDITKGVYSGGTVVVQALQIAFYLGFEEVYLLGCDCGFGEDGSYRFENTQVANPRGKGIQGEWHYVFSAYEICKKAFEQEERKIYNSTVGGKLEVFERIKLEEAVRS